MPHDKRNAGPGEPSRTGNGGAPLLTSDRAEAMAKELEKLGFGRSEQFKLAASVLNKPVRAFTQLTEAEALECWGSAKRLSKSVA